MPLETAIIRDLARLMCRQPPACEEAEMAILGAMILDPKIVPEVAAKLEMGDFWNEANGTIYRVALGVHAKHGTTDLIGMVEPLRGIDFGHAIGEVGIVGYLEKLVRETPGSSGWPYWVRQVSEAARKRRFITAAFNAARKAMAAGPTEDTDEVLADAAEAVSLTARRPAETSDLLLADAEDLVLQQLATRTADVCKTLIGPWDNVFGGLPKTGVVTMLGCPASGKTTASLVMAHGLAKMGMGVRICSYEQPPKRIAATVLSFGSGTPVHDLINRGMSPTDAQWERLRAARDADKALDIKMIEEPMNAKQLYQRAVDLEREGVKVIVADYIQIMPRLPGAGNEVENINESMKYISEIPRRLGMLVVLVSQITAAAARETRPPVAADCIGGSSINQRSDMMISMWRPHQHEQPVEVPNDFGGARRAWRDNQRVAEMIVTKNKYGPMGKVEMEFDGDTMTFSAPRLTRGQDGYSIA